MANEKPMIGWVFLIGLILIMAEAVLMGPIAGPFFVLSTLCAAVFIIFFISLPNPIDVNPFE